METSNTKLRVAHIITLLELGGAQRNTLYTVGHLNPQRFQPMLICGKGGILDKETEGAVWPTYFVRPLVRPVIPFMDIPALIILYRHLRRLKPHIVHTHSSKAGILGRIAAYLAGVPVIVHTFHGFGFTPAQLALTRKLYVTVEKFCARLSTHLIFVSEANRSEAAQLGIGARIPNSLIRSGIELSPASAPTWSAYRGPDRRHKPNVALRQEFGIPETAWLVTYVGNFKPQKNPMDLARTAAEVLKRTSDVHFLLVGDGKLKADVENWCKVQAISGSMHFANWRRREDVARIFGDSDCFLLTSLWEGLPRALVEAFAAGCPAVAYAVDGVQDILKNGENGFLVPPRDVAFAAEKILWLKDHPQDARRMGEKGRQTIEKDFDIERMVRQQEELYEKLYEAVPLKDYYNARWMIEGTTHA